MTSTNTPDPADSHQASEYQLYKRVNEALPAYLDKQAVEVVIAIIRTEKKKLLAAVMERKKTCLYTEPQLYSIIEAVPVSEIENMIMEELDHE